MILTVSRIDAEKRRQPGLPRVPRQRLQRHARARAVRVGDRARGHRRAAGGAPRRPAARPPRRHLSRACARAMCVVVRDLDRLRRADRHDARPARRVRDVRQLRRGRPPLRARARRHARGAAQARPAVRRASSDARRYAPRPYEIVVLSDHGQTQGATFKQRNGYGLDELVERSLGRRRDGDRRRRRAGRDGRARRSTRPPAARGEKRAKNDVSDRDVVVLGSGNLGLVYLMEEPRRLTLEEIDERHPELLPALREHPHVGWVLVRSAEHGAVVLGGARRPLPRRGPDRGRGPARGVLARRPRSTCSAPTASRTSPTSWSAASTTRCSTRAARSRS